MKLFALLTLLVFNSFLLTAQEKFSVPQVSTDQKIEILYNHVIAYGVTGISFAKSKGISPEDYGKFIGKEFSTMWDPASGYATLVNQLMYILAGMHPDNEMQIVKQDDKSITFKLKNIDLPFKNGPMFGVTYADMLDFSYGIISTLAEHMNAKFTQNTTGDGWYVATLSKK